MPATAWELLNMNKKLSLLFLLICSTFVKADYLDGKLAYEAGQYNTAYTEFQNIISQTESNDKADAYFHMGWMYENGLGVELNTEKALENYMRAAELGQSQAQFILGHAYNAGSLGLTRSTKDSLQWYAKAANEGGDKDACYNLGVAYLNGISPDLKPNSELARNWFQVGAQLGSVESAYALAALYYEGNGVPQDTQKAMSLLKQASLMGYGTASFYLAQLYENQNPLTEKDKEEAYYYYLLAQEMGYSSQTMIQKIDKLTLKLEQNTIERVQSRIAEIASQKNQAKEKAMNDYQQESTQ